MMTHEETMEFITALREKYLGEQEETIDDKVERARVILETHKHGSHNQASHGFRFGKAPSLTQARRYRKAGVLDEYSKRSRERSGTKPAKERNAAKPKKSEVDTKVTLTKNDDGYAYAHGVEKFVVSLTGGFPNAAAADVSIEPANKEGKVFARVNVGNHSDGKYFDSFDAASGWVDKFINPPPGRRLSDMVRSNGRLITSKYSGTDMFGRPYNAGDNIYYYANNNGNAKYTLLSKS